jgi:hypothetical protein
MAVAMKDLLATGYPRLGKDQRSGDRLSPGALNIR